MTRAGGALKAAFFHQASVSARPRLEWVSSAQCRQVPRVPGPLTQFCIIDGKKSRAVLKFWSRCFAFLVRKKKALPSSPPFTNYFSLSLRRVLRLDIPPGIQLGCYFVGLGVFFSFSFLYSLPARAASEPQTRDLSV